MNRAGGSDTTTVWVYRYVYTTPPSRARARSLSLSLSLSTHTHTQQRKSSPRQRHKVMTQDTWTARDRCAKSVASKILALANADAMTATCVVVVSGLLSSASCQPPRRQLRHCAYAHPRTQPRTQARTRSHTLARARSGMQRQHRGLLAPRHGAGHDLLDREGGGRQGYQSC